MDIFLHFDEERNYWISEEPYLNLSDIDSYTCDMCFLEQMHLKIETWKDKHNYKTIVTNSWNKDLVPEMNFILNKYVPAEVVTICSEILNNANVETFIHGDLILSNVKLKKDKTIFVCDFENASVGPIGWDASTFMYSLIENDLYEQADWFSKYSDYSKDFLFVIAAVRLARSIKKNIDIERKEKIFEIIKNYHLKKG